MFWKMYRLRLILFVFLICGVSNSQGFLHVNNHDIVDGTGEPVLLRGFGLGGWLVPEGYMLNIPGFGSPTVIREMIVELVGESGANEFYQLYYENYVNREDIDQLAEWGINSVRLPFHYNQFSPSPGETNSFGYDIVDSLLSWCAPHNIFIILDMHCAPGGQNDGGISDSDGTARLWLEDGYKEHTIEIWRSIAETYSENTLIGGYDLINEPVLPGGVSATELRQLYIDITEAIREVDPNHIVFIEGNWYGTDFNQLTPPFDPNMVYSFHKYWSPATVGSIQGYINMRNTNNRPLWMGEAGENSNVWFHEVVSILEDNNIGWNWWTHKKLEKISCPFSAVIPVQYQQVLDYWNGSGSQPSAVFSQAALLAMAQSLSLGQCELRPGVVPALLYPNYDTMLEPYAELNIPGVVPAVHYDIGPIGNAYQDEDYWNVGDGSYNQGWLYRNDGVDIEYSGDPLGHEFSVGWISTGEWLHYTVQSTDPGWYSIECRVASATGGGQFRLELNGTDLTSVISVSNTGGWKEWESLFVDGIYIPEGTHSLRLQAITGGFNIGTMSFTSTASVDGNYLPVDIRVGHAYPNPFNNSVQIPINMTRPGSVLVNIYGTSGKLVNVISTGEISTGERLISWDGSNNNGEIISSGIYFLHIIHDKETIHRKITIIK